MTHPVDHVLEEIGKTLDEHGSSLSADAHVLMAGMMALCAAVRELEYSLLFVHGYTPDRTPIPPAENLDIEEFDDDPRDLGHTGG